MTSLSGWYSRQGIARKLAVVVIGASAAVLVLMSCAIAVHEFVTVRRAKLAELSAVADVLSVNMRAALSFRDAARAGETLHALQATPMVVSADVLDGAGRPFAAFRRPAATAPRGWDSISVSREIVLDRQRIGTIVLVARLAEIPERLLRFLLTILVIGAAVVAFVVVCASRAQRHISEPLLRLASAARRVSAGDYEVRVERASDDEIGLLTDAFNRMARQVALHTRSLLDLNQELLTARQRADESARLKAEFLANMSHEIRTPMNGVMGMIDLALETGLTAEQRDCLRTAKESADSLLMLLNSILDLSKIEAGKLVVESTPLDLAAVLDNVHRLLAIEAHHKGLELIWTIDPAVPSRLLGDPVRIQQILTNLVGNAIKFTAAGEVVTTVSLGGMDPAALRVEFSVRDTGIGIAPDQIASLFDAFVQADGSTTRKYGGTGLGLTISRNLVELMGGRIGLESELGVGSVFRFYLPLRPDAGAMEPRGEPVLSGLRVLIVDDNQVNRRILDGHLGSAGIEVTAASSGEEALARLDGSGASEPFDVIITDHLMPGMDGFDLVARIKSCNLARSSVIMMLSSLDVPQCAAHCRELGIVHYAVKPVSKRSLLQAIATSLRLRVFDPPAAMAASGLPAGLRILVAEDNLINQRLVVRLLEKDGNEIVVTSNGLQALEACQSGSFDVVLMDVQMPVLDGLTATRQLREWESAAGRPKTPVIALTAHALPGDEERCLAAGADAYLSKPVRAAELRTVIANLVRTPAA